ncbi:zinc finger protein 25-like [Diorhabda carinulata]|uniref:zinc finger protein 25-like n=1 Tax=Diorhabda carinulata TaxID=1163345 RepID=UPI0025A106F7|nr:zinc finger protein 25-like [Diorhabda carinulata]
MDISEKKSFFKLNSDICCVCLQQDNLQVIKENEFLYEIFIKLSGKRVRLRNFTFCITCSRKLELISNFIYSFKNHCQLEFFKKESCCEFCFDSNTMTKFPQHLSDVFQKITDFQPIFNCSTNICYKCLNILEETSTFIDIIKNNEQSMKHVVTIKQEIIKENLCDHVKSNEALKIEIKEEINDVDDIFEETPEVKTEFFDETESTGEVIEDGECSENVLKMEIGDEGLQYNYEENIPIHCSVCNRSFETTGGLLNHLKRRLRCRYQTKFVAQFWKCFLKKVAKPFKCQVCLKYFSSIYQKDKHTEAHFGKACVACIFCGEYFIKQKEYLQHYRNHSTKQFPIKCKICPRRFPTKTVYIKHLKTHKDISKNRYRCKKCGSTHSKKSLLLKHTQKEKLNCAYCTKTFCKKSDLTSHLRSHTGEKPYQCAVCSWRFSFKGNLIKHCTIHTGYKAHTCEICLKSFSRADYLKSHYVGVHKKEIAIRKRRQYKKKIVVKSRCVCNICDKVCPSKTSLTSHMRVHNREDTFKCTVCDKSFRYKGLLNGHMKIHLNYRPYACGLCPKTFIKRNDLTRHTKTHTKEKNFKCEICGDRFSRKDVLRLHLRGHTGQRPYECEYCLKTFIQKSNMTHHLKKCRSIFKIDFSD